MHDHKSPKPRLILDPGSWFCGLWFDINPGYGRYRSRGFLAVRHARPLSPRVNPDLLREDVRSQPSEMPTVRERRSRNAEEAQRAERGVCQDSRTGETIVMPDPPLNPQMKDYPGGDEGYPNLHQYNKRGESGNPFLLKASIFLPEPFRSMT